MKKTLITTAVAVGLSLCSASTFAKGYVVNGHAASVEEVKFLAAHGVQPGEWVINGYGIAPADTTASALPAEKSDAKKCWYVLDVPLCD